MDLLEYQGKQLFARHGVPVPTGSPATTVEQAVAAADEIGYPCVIKAQVLIGGRGKAGGIKVAQDRTEAEEHARAILGMDIRGFTVHEVWVEAASDIASEYYASIVFDRAAKKPLVMLSTQGGMDIEEVADNNPDAIARLHVDPLLGFQDFHARRLAFEAGRRRRRRPPGRRAAQQALRRLLQGGGDARRGQPDDRDPRARGEGARRQGHARREQPVPPPRQRRAARRRRRGPAGADGQGARADLREARRQRRHPRQRRRARDVDAGRRRPGGRQAGQLPRRRRRLEGGGDHAGGRGDPLRREGHRRAVQHLRRHHALRRGRQGA